MQLKIKVASKSRSKQGVESYWRQVASVYADKSSQAGKADLAFTSSLLPIIVEHAQETRHLNIFLSCSKDAQP